MAFSAALSVVIALAPGGYLGEVLAAAASLVGPSQNAGPAQSAMVDDTAMAPMTSSSGSN